MMIGYSREIMDFVAVRYLRRNDLAPSENNSFEIKDTAKIKNKSPMYDTYIQQDNL